MNFLPNMRWSPALYAEVAVLAEEAGNELISRLDWMTLKPQTVLDMGCGTGAVTSRLKTYYKNAHVLGIDLSEDMLLYAKQSNKMDPTFSFICAEGGTLPLRDQSVDLIFANLLLPWIPEVTSLLREWRRVLHPQGLLMVTALGLDTMQEWQFVSEEMPTLIDMHDLGDLLLQEKFADPVLEVNHVTLSYRDKETLLKELKGSGMWFPSHESTSMHLISSHQEKCEVTYEIIYAHAFMQAKDYASEGETRIPLSALKQQLKKRKYD